MFLNVNLIKKYFFYASDSIFNTITSCGNETNLCVSSPRNLFQVLGHPSLCLGPRRHFSAKGPQWTAGGSLGAG